ncbi:MAG: universal stress protein [Caldilineaceae bacterium]|nr:universal stress protein [Caldilineaceae bacterium]
MSRKILIPLDQSELAEHVLTYVPWLVPPDKTGAEIFLLSVIEPWRYYFGEVDYNPPELVESLRRATLEYLEGEAAKLRDAGYAVSIQVAGGDAAEIILEVAKAFDISLIAMSTHGRSGMARWAMGSVAERVVQGATMPIFLVRESTTMLEREPLRLLVPLDGSELAELALPKAREAAKNRGAEILLLHVLEKPIEDSMRLLLDSREELNAMVEDWQVDVQTYLESVAEGLRAEGIQVAMRIAWGRPSEIIEQTVEAEQIDLIVMSTHGRTGLSRWVFGSIASKVLHTSTCPLLLVRAIQDGPDGTVDKDKALAGVE